MVSFWDSISQRKTFTSIAKEESKLKRVLTTYDLTALSIGSTLGIGIYVLPGAVAKNVAGPSVVLSFVLAAFACVLSGICYAELSSRVPKAGSAYIYAYVTVGELMAFIIGWVVIMEYVIGASSVARGLSVYVDSLFNGTMEATFREVYQIENVPFLSPYFDFFTCAVCIILGIALSVGLKESARMNNVLVVINVAVMLIVIGVGSLEANFHNWALTPKEVPSGYGVGGFFPYGVTGAIAGAATCFYGFVGFDSITTTGEEVENPQRALPLSIILSLTIICVLYCGVAIVLTLMWPYYLQDVNAPLPYVFGQIGWPWVQWVVTIGGIVGTFASLIGSLLPIPRVVYSMADDGLLFKFLATVHPKFGTPFTATLVTSVIAGVLGGIFNLKQLVDLMSIGTLLAFTLVAVCVLILRYRDEPDENCMLINSEIGESSRLTQVWLGEKTTVKKIFKQLWNWNKLTIPTYLSSAIVTVETILFVSCSIGLVSLVNYKASLDASNFAVYTIITVSVMIFLLISISLQPTSLISLQFKVPFVPILPAISIMFNVYLMLLLDLATWIRFVSWLSVGFVIYFCYGITHSSERKSAIQNQRECSGGYDTLSPNISIVRDPIL
nr:PREDICTED: high affinity cationic amino acid transporter 1-like isoform X1 [Bemisia tabaci]